MSIEPGTYIITNIASGTTVRSYKTGECIFVASTNENPGPFQIYDISTAEGGYLIKSVGLDAFVSAPPQSGVEVTVSNTKEAKAIFEISKADASSYVIKIADQDLLWTVQSPIIPRGDILLEGANGGIAQKFKFQSATA